MFSATALISKSNFDQYFCFDWLAYVLFKKKIKVPDLKMSGLLKNYTIHLKYEVIPVTVA